MEILLVEDDETLSMAIQYSLQNSGYVVDICMTVRDALIKINNKDYSLAIVDIGLPDGNGYNLCKAIKEIKDMPVIFLSAHDEEANIVLGLDLGGDDYITKPVRVRELISRINAVLRRTGKIKNKNEEMVIKFKDIIIDCNKFEVSKKNEKLNLTKNEYKLLLLLLKNKGKVMTRRKILESLWDVDCEFIEDKTLSVYIKRLREKLDDSYNNYIRTIRGIGYCCED